MKKHKNGKKRCVICKKWYKPDERTRKHQKCCGSSRCKKERKSMLDKNWQARHPGYGKLRNGKMRGWAKGYPNYWQEYRRKHPEYCARDNKRRSKRRKEAKMSAKQVTIKEIIHSAINNCA